MTVIDQTKERFFPRAPFAPPPEREPEHRRSAGPVATLGPDPRSGVARERARLTREYPRVWT